MCCLARVPCSPACVPLLNGRALSTRPSLNGSMARSALTSPRWCAAPMAWLVLSKPSPMPFSCSVVFTTFAAFIPVPAKNHTEDRFFGCSGRAAISVLNPAENRKKPNGLSAAQFCRVGIHRNRNTLVNSLVWAFSIKVVDIGFNHPRQMPLTQHEHVIQALPADRFLKPFTDRVGVGCRHWGFEYLNTRTGSNPSEVHAVFAVVIANQVLGSLTKRRSLSQLLRGPGIGRVRRNAEVNHAPRGQFHDEKHKVLPEE